MTGPKNEVSSAVPGENVRIGVPTSPPVRLDATAVSSRSTSSHFSSSAAATMSLPKPAAVIASPISE